MGGGHGAEEENIKAGVEKDPLWGQALDSDLTLRRAQDRIWAAQSVGVCLWLGS